MKKVLLSLLVMVILSVMVYSGTITVLHPNGGETLKKGEQISITWNANGITNPFKITLWRNNSLVGVINQRIPVGNGRLNYEWKVGDYVGGKASIGGGYKIKIKEKTTAVADFSNNSFNIDSPNRGSVSNRVTLLKDLELRDLFYRNGKMFTVVKSNKSAFRGKALFTIEIPGGFKFDLEKNLIIGKNQELEVFLRVVRPDIITAKGRLVKLILDKNNTIKELNENNNVIEKFIKVLDLKFKKSPKSTLRFSKDIDTNKWICRFNIFIKQNVNKKLVRYVDVSYKFSKIGGNDGQWVKARLTYLSDNEFSAHNVDSFLPVPEQGKFNKYRVFVKIDPENIFPEINEKNNNKVFSFKVGRDGCLLIR